MIKNIRKNWWKILKRISLFFLLFIVIYVILCMTTRIGMLRLPEGEYISSLDSPDKLHTLKAYRYSGGATMDWSLRVEVVNNKTDKKLNIYYVYHEKDADMKWVDNRTVIINGIKLDIYDDYYKDLENADRY